MRRIAMKFSAALPSALALLLGIASAPAQGQSASGGTDANLSLGAGARGIALGGSFLADASDATGIYWNPAALAWAERGNLCLMHAPIGFGDAAQSFGGAVYPTLRAGTFGVGALRLATGGIQAFDATSVSQGEISYSETAFYLAYAAAPTLPGVGRGLSIGFSAKSLNQSIPPWSTTAAGLDAALGFAPQGLPGLKAAAVLENAIAPRLQLDQAPDVLPRVLHLGGSYRVALAPGSALGLHAGVDHQHFLGWSPRLGVEWSYRDRLHARLGTSRFGTAFGVGVSWGRGGLDYAYLSRSQSATHPVSLDLGFGASVSEQRLAREAARRAAAETEARVRLRALVEPHVAAAQNASARGDYALAADEWKQITALDPSDTRAGAALKAAAAKLDEEQKQAAEAAAAAALRESAAKERAAARATALEAALGHLSAGDDAKALVVLQALLEQDPSDDEVRGYLQGCQARLHGPRVLPETASRTEESSKRDAEGEPVVKTEPETRKPPKPAPATRGHVATPRPAKSVSAASKPVPAPVVQAPAPAAPRALSTEERARVREFYLRGMSAFTANDFDKAIAEWTKILAVDPGNASAQKNIDEARARLRALK